MFLGIFRNDLQKIVKKESKFGPPGAKKTTIFGPFLVIFHSFLDIEIFLVNDFFWFFLIWCFWACLEVICKKLWKKGQNSTLQGQKTAIFWPFSQFFGLRNFSSVWIFLIFYHMMFLGIFRSDLQKILKKGSNFEGLKKDVIFQIPQKLAWNLAPCFATKCSNHL